MNPVNELKLRCQLCDFSTVFSGFVILYTFFLRKMIDRAWAWAKSRGRVRTNEVHGEDEIKIILHESFGVSKADIESLEQSGSFTVQDT